MEGEQARRVVCVTGAGGFVASWLVKFLLSTGYRVHGTVRDPSDEKNAHLYKLEGATENLQLFKVDLLDYDALQAAITGCEGVFHVASPVPVPTTKITNPEVEVIAPAVTGTLNVLKACSVTKVKRLVVVSSIGAIEMNPNWPKGKVRDEDCWSDKEYCKNTENWYCLSKTLAEAEALEYAKEHGLDVVTVCPATVLGPLLQSTVNTSSSYLINLFKGQKEILENRFFFVDVRDVADALIMVYEKPEASGRYICAPHLMKICELSEMLKSMYPNYEYPKIYTEVENIIGLLSTEKLKLLGWKSRTLKVTLVDSVECYEKAGLLDKD